MQHQHAATQKTHQPTKFDILVVGSMTICLMGVLSLVMYETCAQMHAEPLAWLVLLATIWLPAGSLLVLFPFSRWPNSDRKEADFCEQGNVDEWKTKTIKEVEVTCSKHQTLLPWRNGSGKVKRSVS